MTDTAHRAARVVGEPGGSGTFVVPSKSMPGILWTIEWRDDVSWCGCPGFTGHKRCWHVNAVADELGRERQEIALRPRLERKKEMTRLFELFGRE